MLTALMLFSLGRTDTVAVSDLPSAYGWLKSQQVMQIDLSGTTVLGTENHTLYSQLLLNVETNPDGTRVIKVNMATSRDGAWLCRWIGDGKTLWFYDERFNEYATFEYGADSLDSPEAYPRALTKTLVSWSRQEGTALSRMLSDLQVGGSNSFYNWLPGGESGVFDDSVYFRIGAPVTRQVLFNLNPSTKHINSLQWYSLDRFVNDKFKETNWTMTFYPQASLPPTWSFDFVPPIGARAVARPRGGS